jgi:threonine dehydrogenase-like Zn-dependent dehydrogenase
VSEFRGPGLVFVAERDCRVEEAVVDTSSLRPGEVVLEVECSVISAGTEVANFTGLDPGTRVPGSWNAYPHRPGYGAVGRVLASGPQPSGEDGFAVGDRVFAICRHARYAVADASKRPVLRIREDDDARTIVLARMASVAIITLRKSSSVELGSTAVVVGLGLVGNFAAQLLGLAGMNVVALDLVDERVEMAEGVGITARRADKGSERRVVESVIGGAADLVVEASGVPDSVPLAVSLARDGGEVVLLGSPRGVFSGDATSMLIEIHRRGIRMIGTLEWLLPLHSGTWESRWSLNEDYKTLFDLVRRGAIKTAGLVTDIVGPADAQKIYSRLADREPGIGGVLLDWS